jgi:antibiotic biosynthesis monooxygenase (ABM) superfamily enzyme
MENDIIGMVWNLSVHNIVIAYCCAITEKLSYIPKTLVMTMILVPIMVLVIIPSIHKHFHDWLRK